MSVQKFCHKIPCYADTRGRCTCCNWSSWPGVEYYPAPPLQGCICPPTSERTCESPICPRKNHLKDAGV